MELDLVVVLELLPHVVGDDGVARLGDEGLATLISAWKGSNSTMRGNVLCMFSIISSISIIEFPH